MVFAEALTEYLINGLSEALAKAEEPTPPIPLAADRYIALSALQKAIRRGEEELALRAAMNLMIGGPHAIWRRLGIIAFEDIGVANIDAVGWATVLIGKPDVRQRLGGEWRVADFLIRTLCRSAKCRATDDLVHLIERDPALADLRDRLAAHDGPRDAETLQTIVFAVGNAHGFEPLRDWFKAIYEVLLGASQGPRFGGFIAVYGVDETVALIDRGLAGELAA